MNQVGDFFPLIETLALHRQVGNAGPAQCAFISPDAGEGPKQNRDVGGSSGYMPYDTFHVRGVTDTAKAETAGEWADRGDVDSCRSGGANSQLQRSGVSKSARGARKRDGMYRDNFFLRPARQGQS